MAVHPNGTGGHAGEQLVGLVEGVNEKGVKIAGEWRNISKWATDVTLPERGQVVAVALDKSGYVRAIAPAAATPDAQQQPSAGRETLIIRQTCIKAAAEFCASRPELRSADLIALAERMEQWVLREGS